VETVQHLAVVLGRNRVTVQRWLSQYRSGGLNQLLVGKSTGRTALIPEWAVERLKQELLEGISSYEEVRLWLAAELGIQRYDVVHNLVHEKLKADKKVARPKQRARARRSRKLQKRTGSKHRFKEVKKQSKSLRVRYCVKIEPGWD